MKNLMLTAVLAITFFTAGAQDDKPNLGKVVDGYLVNVDERGVILQGHDPVSFRNGGDLPGDPKFQTKYRGAIYYFASAENKAKFDANPAAYEPEYGGYCAYGVSVGHLAPIELWTFDTTYQNRNIFQHNQKAVSGWKKDVPGNDALAKKEWAKFQEKYLGSKPKVQSVPATSGGVQNVIETSSGSTHVAQTANLTLDGAQAVMAAAVAYAKANQSPGGSIAVVDAGGHLLLFGRLDGSFPASASVAIEKARTAALFKFESKKLEDSINGGRDALITVGYTFLQGGVPVMFNGQVVGAIGVSGAKSADQDREIALAGAEGLHF